VKILHLDRDDDDLASALELERHWLPDRVIEDRFLLDKRLCQLAIDTNHDISRLEEMFARALGQHLLHH